MWKCPNKEECSEQILQDILTENLGKDYPIRHPAAFIARDAAWRAQRHVARCLNCNQGLSEDDPAFEPALYEWLDRRPQIEQEYHLARMLSDFAEFVQPESFLVFKLGFVWELSDDEIYGLVTEGVFPKDFSTDLRAQLLAELRKTPVDPAIRFEALKKRKSRAKWQFILFCRESYPELFGMIRELLKKSKQKSGVSLLEKIERLLIENGLSVSLANDSPGTGI
ncbi:MAG: hypothetical protein JSS81_11665 [Acidobacteria bacterium]|nr:hypothetical protein [Acidobacteriota bacterium]